MGTALLGSDDRPSAIFAGCDASALGVYEAARRLGLVIPRDLSVVGFDDTAAALWSAPPLTTVRQPITELGRVALRTLLEQSRGEPPVSHHLQLATRLVARESTAPIAGSPVAAESETPDVVSVTGAAADTHRASGSRHRA